MCIILLIILLQGCSESTALKKNYNFVKEQYRDWFCQDSIIKMVDDNGFEYFFMSQPLTESDLGGSSRFMFVYTATYYNEYLYQNFISSNSKINHNVSLTAYEDGNLLSIFLGGYYQEFSGPYFYYNLDNKQVSSSSSDAVVIFLNEYSINNNTYYDVMNVKFKPKTNNDYEIVEFFYAKRRGLIKFVYQCGEKCQRI